MDNSYERMTPASKTTDTHKSGGHTEEPLSFERVWQMFQETNKRFQETDKKFQDTDKKFQDTDKKLNRLERLFTSQWGKLIESLVEGDLITILRGQGIEVHDTVKRRSGSRDGQHYEFDIIAINQTDLVIVEVKTTLRPDDIDDFIRKLRNAKAWMTEYADRTIFGAVAYLTEDAGSAALAQKKGLFVIRATGDSASIINEPGFRPTTW